MAMKVPTFKSQTQPGDDPANIMLGIQANPSAMSQGAVAKANFGNQLANTGSTVFDLGVQIQEIKNTTEATRINNEYKKGSSLIMERSKLFEVKDQEEFVRGERAKLKTSLLNGITYTLKGQGGGEDYLFNVSSDTGSANPIVKNKKVKRTVGSYFSEQDLLDDVDLHKIQITSLTNNLIHDFNEKQKNLVNSVIKQYDTASGQVARNELYGTPGVEAVVDGQGKTIFNAQPAIPGLIGEMEKAGLFASEADKFKKLQEIDTQISHGLALDLERRVREAESPTLKRAILNQLEDFQKHLSIEDPNNKNQYLNFPFLNRDARLKLINKIDDTHYSEIKKINQIKSDELKSIKDEIELKQLGKEEEILANIRGGGDVSPAFLEELRSKGAISKTFADNQIKYLQEKANGSNIIVSFGNMTEFAKKYNAIQNPRDVKNLIDETLEDGANRVIDQTTHNNRLTKLYARKDSSTPYGISVSENLVRLYNAMESLGATAVEALSDKKIKTNIESRYENLFYEALDDQQGIYPSVAEIEKITDQIISQYRKQKSNNTGDIVEMMTGKDAVLTQHFNSALYDAYNNMGKVNGEMDPDFPVINSAKEYIIAYQNNPKVETQLRKAYLNLKDRQEISPRLFNAKLKELALLSKSYDPNATPMDAFNIDFTQGDN